MKRNAPPRFGVCAWLTEGRRAVAAAATRNSRRVRSFMAASRLGGGLRPPSDASPQGSIARAKTALGVEHRKVRARSRASCLNNFDRLGEAPVRWGILRAAASLSQVLHRHGP